MVLTLYHFLGVLNALEFWIIDRLDIPYINLSFIIFLPLSQKEILLFFCAC